MQIGNKQIQPALDPEVASAAGISLNVFFTKVKPRKIATEQGKNKGSEGCNVIGKSNFKSRKCLLYH